MCSEGGGEEERYRTNFSPWKFSGGKEERRVCGKRRGGGVSVGWGHTQPPPPPPLPKYLDFSFCYTVRTLYNAGGGSDIETIFERGRITAKLFVEQTPLYRKLGKGRRGERAEGDYYCHMHAPTTPTLARAHM